MLPASLPEQNAPIQAQMQSPIFDGPELDAQAPDPIQLPPGTQELPPPTAMPSGPEHSGSQPQPEPMDEALYVPCPEPMFPRWWHRLDFLVLTTPNGNLPISLAYSNTTGLVLSYFDGTDLEYGNYPGVRYTIGRWLDRDHRWGLEVNALYAVAHDVDFFMNSTATVSTTTVGNVTTQPLVRPYIDPDTGTQSFLDYGLTTNTADLSASMAINSQSQIWGGGFNLSRAMWEWPGLRVAFLAGARFLELRENLDVFTLINTSNSTNSPIFFQGTSTSGAVVNDSIDARNQFGGANLAARCEWQCDTFFVNLQGNIAFGTTRQTTTLAGSSSNGASVVQGGFLVQSTNQGTFTGSDFSVIPEVNLTIGVQCGPHWRFFGGYDLLVWSVVRPGTQIDPRIDLARAPVTTLTNQFDPASATGFPAPRFETDRIWIQGLRLGFEFQY